jgi:hypothetical protein
VYRAANEWLTHLQDFSCEIDFYFNENNEEVVSLLKEERHETSMKVLIEFLIYILLILLFLIIIPHFLMSNPSFYSPAHNNDSKLGVLESNNEPFVPLPAQI